MFVASLSVAIAQGDRSDGWQIPAGAADEQSPIQPTPDVLAKGKAIFKSKCQRCHGATGVGNGPDADPDHSPGDLTDGKRASRNPDGVMFYKVWNGRAKPKMPAFKTDISRTEVWTVIQFVKTLRQ
jgi:mono/diheme cytochrome c family protein